MVQNSDPSGNGLNPGAWAGVGLGAAGCIFVFCMWVFRWSKRSRDNIVRGEDAVGKMKRAFKIDGKGKGVGRGRGKAQTNVKMQRVGVDKVSRLEMGRVREKQVDDEENGVVKMPSPVAKGA